MKLKAIRRRIGWIPWPVRKALVLVIGGTVVLIGIVMFVTPGPAILVIPLGLAILAIEFAWARRWLKKVKAGAQQMQRRVKSGFGRKKGAAASDAAATSKPASSGS